MMKSRVFIATTAVATGALVAVGVASASIPDAQGDLHGCYKTTEKPAGSGLHGGLKVLDTAVSASCPFGQNIKLSTDIPVYAEVVVSGGTATLVNNSHVSGLGYASQGLYTVTFDRHVDNCSFSVTQSFHGGSLPKVVFQISNGLLVGGTNNVEVIAPYDSATHTAVDSDFDLTGVCPPI